MIASSPTDLQSVLDTIAERVAKLCDAEDAAIFRLNGNFLRLVAHFGPIPMADAVGESFVIDRDTPASRAIADRQTIHVHDLRAAETEFPGAKTRGIAVGVRTVLSTPLLREGIAIGTIHIRRREMHPFSDREIKVLETFADQAVIAIENARLFKELENRNRDLTEALEQQTVTSEVLRVIAGSPTELQPVLDAVIENAVRLAGAKQGHIRQYNGEFLRVVAYHNVGAQGMTALQETPVRPGLETSSGRAFLERMAIHIPDVNLDPTFRLPLFGARTLLAVPMLREGNPIATISIWRENVMPFTERQIELVTTFADQAVIAIENVRLFKELEARTRDLSKSVGELR